MRERVLLKDILFGASQVERIGTEISAVYGDFECEKFVDETYDGFESLELKERMYKIANTLRIYLPPEYPKAIDIILKSMPAELDPSKSDNDFGEHFYASYSTFVNEYGLSGEYLDISLRALSEMTKRFSVEYAVRDFLNEFYDETMQILFECSISKNYHQRRLASEGTRPKLPWAKKLNISYHDPLPLLDVLYYDETRYVTRSVANHLNDISKIDADFVIETLNRWHYEKKQSPKEMEYITRHSLRTLIKQGNKRALTMLGFDENPNIEVKDIRLSRSDLQIGESVDIEFEIFSEDKSRLMIDYIMHYPTKMGGYTQKVYKIKTMGVDNEVVKIVKKHHFKSNMTTRRLYNGIYKIQLQINGRKYQKLEFNLTTKG